jgi:hypothetical protein
MTGNNSGDVRKYDGKPMPSSTQQRQQFDESLDDLMPDEIETPKRKDVSAAPYTAIVPAPNYSIQKNTS